MSYDNFTIFNVKIESAVAWVTFDYPPVNIQGLPMSGEMDKDGIADLMGVVKEAIPGGMKLTPMGWTAEGDRVALEMESYGVKANGTVYNNLYHFLITFSGGKITSLREYMDTYHAKLVFIDD